MALGGHPTCFPRSPQASHTCQVAISRDATVVGLDNVTDREGRTSHLEFHMSTPQNLIAHARVESTIGVSENMLIFKRNAILKGRFSGLISILRANLLSEFSMALLLTPKSWTFQGGISILVLGDRIMLCEVEEEIPHRVDCTISDRLHRRSRSWLARDSSWILG